MAQVDPFTIAVPDSALADLRGRLRASRWPQVIEGQGWTYGMDPDFLRRLVMHWETAYDWRRQEQAMNAIPNRLVATAGGRLHALVQSSFPHRPALLLINGWPSTCFEYLKLIPLLADDFDVVVLSLPGFGWSAAPSEGGVNPRRIAALFAEAMQALGYSRFGVHGSDWGASIGTLLAWDFPERVSALHLTQVPPYLRVDRGSAGGVGRSQFLGFLLLQSYRPDALAYALNDSPAGLAAWILDKWRPLADCGGNLEQRFGIDELLTVISIYWFTQSIGSSMRLYFEGRRPEIQLGDGKRVETPTEFAFFPFPAGQHPGKDILEAGFNLVRRVELPRGGHFHALEEPELLAADLKEFFGPGRELKPST